MYACLFGSEDSKKAGFVALPGKITTPLAALERNVPKSGWVNGRSLPSLADLCLYDLVNSPFPGLKALK